MDSWALVSSALFCVYRPHPWPVGHPLSMNGNGEWTSACGRCDRFGDGEWTPAAAGVCVVMGNGRPPRRASWIWRGGVTSACGRCDRFGEGGQDACRGGRYGLCEGEKKSGSRNRKAESRSLKAES